MKATLELLGYEGSRNVATRRLWHCSVALTPTSTRGVLAVPEPPVLKMEDDTVITGIQLVLFGGTVIEFPTTPIVLSAGNTLTLKPTTVTIKQ